MRTLLAILGLSTMLFVAPARACWDGELAEVGGVTYMGGDPSWSRDRARELATWLARIDALLAPGETLTIEWGTVTLCSAGEASGCIDWEWDRRSMATLFREVAGATGASEATARRARAVRAPIHTVQIASLADRARAEALAQRIGESGIGEHGFYQAGGFPADNPVAHVVATSIAGRTTYRVIVGAFVDPVQAARVRDGLDEALGVRGLVRAL